MVQGMAPPVQPKPQPKPALKIEEHPIPEFMWCQRMDRVYVTIKVADCANASVDVTEDNALEFRGTGHGMCGQRDYMLSVELADAVVPNECCWFVSGPSVRVRLQKAKVGPHWPALLKAKRKMPQLKVDWSSWLDEDEEHEASAAPNGFDVPAMKMMMVGSDKDPLYRDLDKFDSSTTPDEGEELNSIVIDEGMNSIDDLQIKFKALEYEREELARTKEARYNLRKATREAQLAQKQRERDLQYRRQARELTPEEKELLANADGLYERLKAEKQTEKLYWLSKWWHQRRPERKKIDIAMPVAKQACLEQIAIELAELEKTGEDPREPKTRRKLERRVFLKTRDACLSKFNEWVYEGSETNKRQDIEGKKHTSRDIAARLTREEVALALGVPVPELAKSMQLKQFADPRPDDKKPFGGKGGDDDGADDEESSEGEYIDDDSDDGWVTASGPIKKNVPKEEPAIEEVELELEENDGTVIELEDNDGDAGPELELEANDDVAGALQLEANDGEEEDGSELELEEN